MARQNTPVLVGILLLAILAVFISVNNLNYDIPPTNEGSLPQDAPLWANFVFWQGDQQRSIRTHYGLDLVGGSQVVLEADLTAAEAPNLNDEELADLMQAARVVVENRVSGGLGVVEPRVQLGGNNRIIVELPEVDDPDQAVSLIRETGRLEFVEMLQTPVDEGTRIRTSLSAQETEPAALDIDAVEAVTQTFAFGGQVFPTVMTGAQLEDAQVGIDQTGGYAIDFTLTADGQETFSEYTRNHVGDFLAITLDGVVVSAPVIQQAITTRDGQITGGTGGFSLDEAEDIAIKLKYGALPVPLKIVENRTVGPSLGQQSVQRSLRAGTIGLIVVLLFMLVYYRVPGIMAALALILYALLNFSLYKLIPVTLTVPAITGFILSIGMAVDANILVFERMREELRSGRSVRSAMEAGFARAWPSIRDANLSTLITCAILFWFGSNFGASIVRGFAVTLAIGVGLNLFTAVTVTRSLLRLVVQLFNKPLTENMSQLVGVRLGDDKPSLPNWVTGLFHMVQYRRWFYMFSTLIIGLGIAAMVASSVQYGSPLRLSIDYTGGTLWEMRFNNSVQPAQVRDFFDEQGYTGAVAQAVAEDNAVIVRTKEITIDEKTALDEVLTAEFGSFEDLRFETVGPTIGQEVTQASSVAVSTASLAILIFIWYAFRAIPNAFRYGISAIVAMLHDILVTAGAFAILGFVLGWEIDALFLSAILTVIGYSVNDTIVVFDRIRENIPRYRSEPFEIVASRSLLETLQRSLATSVSTLFVIGAILVFGGVTTRQFTVVMLIGIISGTYSSIFTAVPFLVSWYKGDFGRLVRREPRQAEAVG